MLEKVILSFIFFFGTVFSVCIISVLLHEAAHAVGGMLTGYRVAEYCFWFPCPLTHVRFGDTWVIFGARFGGGGWCVLYPKRPEAGRSVLSTAAGPAADLVITGLLWALYFAFQENRIAGGYIFIGAVYSTATFLVSLHPHEAPMVGRRHNNDMAMLLNELKNPDADKIRRLYGLGLFQQGRCAEAEEFFRDALSRKPEDDFLKLCLADIFSARGKFEEANQIYRAYLNHDQYGPFAKNLLAWNYVQSGQQEDLERAARLSEYLMELDPSDADFKGTRGTVLLLMGKRDEARPLLAESFRQHIEPEAKGEMAASLALLEAQSGKSGLAAQYLKQAQYFRSKSTWVERVESRMRASAPNLQ